MAIKGSNLLVELERLGNEARSFFEKSANLNDLQELRTKYLGKKGSLNGVLKGLKDLSSEERPKVGELANKLRIELEELLLKKQTEIKEKEINASIAKEYIDITLPGKRRQLGAIHPISRSFHLLEKIFRNIGFSVARGPEVETEFCNFEALNMPEAHPARDMQDSLYVCPGIVLRTQTSCVQIRTMLAQKPPLKIVAPGAVFRNDSVDASHSPMFHQLEGLYINENVTMEELKGTLEYFVKEMFGQKTQIRFRSSFFPFTEPSVEVDCSCVFCKGKGCSICKNTGWMEILGAGMVHPSLYEKVGYEKGKYSGFAFGIGVDRVAMLLYGIEDIRLLYENDLRFLEQYS